MQERSSHSPDRSGNPRPWVIPFAQVEAVRRKRVVEERQRTFRIDRPGPNMPHFPNRPSA